MIRDFNGISADKLIQALKEVPGDTKICIDVLNEKFPVRQVEECTYYDWNNGKKIAEHKGILII
ncbi:hypothetical protein EXM65_14300 [Clostridium botulinum]|uniref:Uncharacterized protein n=1 Tax=Clostridium botulinum TaxID=1491 RepID=A0A6M0SSF3_CLOBO|nr:hypothetical protein [Clostridium botulinum]